MTRCRLCGAAGLERIIDLGFHPLADRFLVTLDEPEVTYPLVVNLCGECGYAGLTHVVPPEVRYQAADYSYTAGNSKVSRDHFTELATDAIERIHLNENDFIVDIGGNDGTLLESFRFHVPLAELLNIEPSSNIADISRTRGNKTMEQFWNRDLALAVAQMRWRSAMNPMAVAAGASLITATNMFNHESDPNEFVRNVATALRPGGYFVFEVPSLRQMVHRRSFDTVYLEHVSYFGLKPLVRMLEDFGFGVEHAVENDYMGGSLRVYARSGGTAHAPDVLDQIDTEESDGIYDPASYVEFMQDVELMRDRLLDRLHRIRKVGYDCGGGGSVVGIGAAAKGNTLLNYCGINRSLISTVADASPLKIGKFTPGSHLPIIADSAIPAHTTHALILPWNLAGFLKDKLARTGLDFIIPQMAARP